HEAIAAAIPDRECLVHRDRHLTWAEVNDRTRRFAAGLAERGVGRRGALADVAGWESPHHHVALYLHHGAEYLDAMLGTMEAGAAAIDVNCRSVAEGLRHLLTAARARVVVRHEAFSPVLAEVLPHRPAVELLVRVPDGSGRAPLPGAVDYEELLAAADPA